VLASAVAPALAIDVDHVLAARSVRVRATTALATRPRTHSLLTAGLVGAAVATGVGSALITPLGFAALAASAPPERLGATMGAAEVGRELGDAGGPLIVGLAATASLAAGLGVLAGLLGAGAAIGILRRTSHDR